MEFKNYLFKNFEMYRPDLARIAESYKTTGDMELTVELVDGRTVIYFVLWNMAKTLNTDIALTEEECRLIFALKVKYRLYVKSSTQDDLAMATGISRVMINRYLSGKATPSWYAICKIADALKCSTDELRRIK